MIGSTAIARRAAHRAHHRGDDDEERGDETDADRIGGRDVVEKRAHEARAAERSGDGDENADGGEAQTID